MISFLNKYLKGAGEMSVQKKNDIFYAVIPYRDNLNRKRNKWIKVGPKQREAERVERKLRADFERGELIFSKKMTIRQFLELWLEKVVKINCGQNTYANYSQHCKSIINVLGDIEISKFTAINAQEYINLRIKEVLPTTVQTYFSTFKSAMDCATKWKLISSNPCHDVVIPKRNKPRSGAYTIEQAEILLNVAMKSKIYMAIILGMLCGLRRGELCALNLREDINKDTKKAYIKHSLFRMKISEAKKLTDVSEFTPLWDTIKSKKSTTVLTLGPVKTPTSEQTISLPDIVIAAIGRIEKEQEFNKHKLKESYQDYGFVCCWENGTPYDPDYINKAFHDVVNEYNSKLKKNQEPLPVLRLHDLRHTYATMLLESNVDVKIVSRGIRHSRSSFTSDTYQHVIGKMKDAPASVMDDIFSTKKKNVK